MGLEEEFYNSINLIYEAVFDEALWGRALTSTQIPWSLSYLRDSFWK